MNILHVIIYSCTEYSGVVIKLFPTPRSSSRNFPLQPRNSLPNLSVSTFSCHISFFRNHGPYSGVSVVLSDQELASCQECKGFTKKLMFQQKVNKTFLMCRWDAKYLKNSLGWILVNSPSKFRQVETLWALDEKPTLFFSCHNISQRHGRRGLTTTFN